MDERKSPSSLTPSSVTPYIYLNEFLTSSRLWIKLKNN